ncbi:hypothetical protein BS78_06G014000 [Paspalum vaginatum]|nr:hypothetical protein BS78_06G014000 [Paspalum vaginatum]
MYSANQQPWDSTDCLILIGQAVLVSVLLVHCELIKHHPQGSVLPYALCCAPLVLCSFPFDHHPDERMAATWLIPTAGSVYIQNNEGEEVLFLGCYLLIFQCIQGCVIAAAMLAYLDSQESIGLDTSEHVIPGYRNSKITFSSNCHVPSKGLVMLVWDEPVILTAISKLGSIPREATLLCIIFSVHKKHDLPSHTVLLATMIGLYIILNLAGCSMKHLLFFGIQIPPWPPPYRDWLVQMEINCTNDILLFSQLVLLLQFPSLHMDASVPTVCKQISYESCPGGHLTIWDPGGLFHRLGGKPILKERGNVMGRHGVRPNKEPTSNTKEGTEATRWASNIQRTKSSSPFLFIVLLKPPFSDVPQAF